MMHGIYHLSIAEQFAEVYNSPLSIFSEKSLQYVTVACRTAIVKIIILILHAFKYWTDE